MYWPSGEKSTDWIVVIPANIVLKHHEDTETKLKYKKMRKNKNNVSDFIYFIVIVIGFWYNSFIIR